MQSVFIHFSTSKGVTKLVKIDNKYPNPFYNVTVNIDDIEKVLEIQAFGGFDGFYIWDRYYVSNKYIQTPLIKMNILLDTVEIIDILNEYFNSLPKNDSSFL
mgnify:CR=1 FL=1